MSEAKLFEVATNSDTEYVKADSKAKAKAWAVSKITVREIGAVEALSIDAKDIQDAGSGA